MEESNKIISEFMGLETPFNEISDATLYRYKGIDEKGEYQFDVELHEMRYHLSWDWLMPVISKITKDERYFENEYRESIMDVVPYGNIEDTIKTIVEFIKEYNQNN